MKSTSLALASSFLGMASAVSAQLSGTEIAVTQFFQGTQTFGSHVYGLGPAGASEFHDLQAPQHFWIGTSPAAGAPATFDNSLLCDYTGFHSALLPYAGTTSSMILNTIQVPVEEGSVHVFDSAGAVIALGGVIGTMIIFEVEVDDIRSGPTPTMVIAWDNEDGGCYPDCNGDGVLNLADFGCFQTAFALGEQYADCNLDLVLNLADFGCFQTAFALGCP